MRRLFVTVVILFMLFSVSISEAHFYNGCKKNECKRHIVKPFKPHLLSIAYCESRYHWYINGTFDGGLQFSPGTWNATGSHYKFAYQAPILEQMYRGVVWASMISWAWRTTAGWPNCG